MKKKNINSIRVAIVTGGASGLGLAIAKKFVDNNLLTIITGRDDQKLKAAKDALGELCVPLKLDVTKLSRIPDHIKMVVTKYGRVDVLVNNAGINLKKDFLEVTDEEFQKIIQTNLTGVFTMSREVSKVMSKQKSGSIINISSMAAHYGLPKVVAYAASKSAVEGMTRIMAVELAPYNIRVNCIAPGFIKTAMVAKAFDSDTDRRDRVLQRTPLGKLGLPEDIASAAYFLASDENAFITGAILPVDGGNSIGF